MPYLLTIGNTDASGFADWHATTDGHPDVTVIPTVGTFHGDRENGVAVIAWTDDREQVARLLGEYGADHPDELVFGVMPLPDSTLHANPAAAAAAA